MSEEFGYWGRRSISRRTALRGAMAAGLGSAALGLINCGGGTKAPATGATAVSAQTDSAKGKPGGTFKANTNIYPAGLTLIDRRDNISSKMAGLVHSALLGYAFGRPGVAATDVTKFEPDLARALPEQSDPLTYVYKLKQAKFHNGRAVSAEDVRYSYDRYANYEKSIFRSNWAWFDKVETPDPQTVVVKTKSPYADALASMTGHDSAYIMAKEFEESPEAALKMMGSGPFIFVSSEPPVSSTYRKNPDYYDQPYPYFDQVQLLATTDTAKRVADFSSHGVNLTWWNDEATRDQIKKNRPDAQTWYYPGAGFTMFLRGDKPPFNDKRVRQALSMSINRQAISQAVFLGEGKDDQALSWSNTSWGFRKPAELGDAARFWKYDVQAAKQLLSAAGFDKPLEANWSYGVGIGGNATADIATLTQANWRDQGIANIKNNALEGNQYLNSVATGNYEGMAHGPGGFSVIVGPNIYNNYYWAPGGERSTLNASYTNDPRLSELVQKQLTQLKLDERKQTFREIEQTIADNQYRIVFPTISYSWFADASLKNMQVPAFSFSGSSRFFMYWWFDKA